MIKTFTQDDILRYVYDETDAEESELIRQTLQYDEELQSFYTQLRKLKTDLNKAVLEPSEVVIQKILEYSRNY
jgi:cell shape-determining protein MreC